jgi:hypothetical protein
MTSGVQTLKKASLRQRLHALRLARQQVATLQKWLLPISCVSLNLVMFRLHNSRFRPDISDSGAGRCPWSLAFFWNRRVVAFVLSGRSPT